MKTSKVVVIVVATMAGGTWLFNKAGVRVPGFNKA